MSLGRIRRFIRKTQSHYLTWRLIFSALASGDSERLSTQLLTLQHRIKSLSNEATETNISKLYAAVGRALTSWSQMEELLVLLVARLLKVSPEKAGLIMYSIYNSNTWMTVIHDLFDMEPELKPCQLTCPGFFGPSVVRE